MLKYKEMLIFITLQKVEKPKGSASESTYTALELVQISAQIFHLGLILMVIK